MQEAREYAVVSVGVCKEKRAGFICCQQGA
jgi:hypothetical protein